MPQTLTQDTPLNLRALAISGGSVLLALAARRLVRRYKLPQLDMFAALLLVAVPAYLFGWSQPGPTGKAAVALIEEVPAALPGLHIPVIEWDWVGRLSSGAFAIAVLGLLETLAIAKAISYKTRQPLDFNQQCLAALATLVIGVEFSISIGVLVSLLLFVPRAAKLEIVELVVTEERIVRERVASDPAAQSVLIYDLEGELFFGAAPDLERHLRSALRRRALEAFGTSCCASSACATPTRFVSSDSSMACARHRRRGSPCCSPAFVRTFCAACSVRASTSGCRLTAGSSSKRSATRPPSRRCARRTNCSAYGGRTARRWCTISSDSGRRRAPRKLPASVKGRAFDPRCADDPSCQTLILQGR